MGLIFNRMHKLLSILLLLILLTQQSVSGRVFKPHIIDDVLISDYESERPSDISDEIEPLPKFLIDNAPQCSSMNAAFSAGSDNRPAHSCKCFLDTRGVSTARLATTPKLFIRCVSSVMPNIYKELNALESANVSELWIVDAHAVVIPAQMFNQVRPQVIGIERARLALIREGAFKYFDKSLRSLILRDNLLANLDPKLFSNLHRLEELDIGKNKIAQLFYEILNPLDSLQILRVDNNNLAEIVDGTFETLANLRVLDLSKNKLHNVTKETFRGLENLEELYLQGNHFSEFHPATFSHLKKLRVLNISNNDLSSIKLVDLPNLETLSVSGNRLNSLLKLKLRMLPNVKQLFVNNNKISRIEMNDLLSLDGLDKLKLLSLDGNMISFIEPSALHAIANIEAFSLQNNRLKQLSNGVRSYFDELKAVKQLNLAYNRLYKIRSLDLGTLKTLEELQLNDNFIEEIDPKAFYNLRLKKLSLATNHLNGLANGIFESFDISRVEFIDLTGNPWECQYTDQWLDGWLSTLKESCIKDYKQLSCTATSEQYLFDANRNELMMSRAVPLYQANSLFVSPFRTFSFLVGCKSWILICISGIPCLVLLLILIVFCYMNCKKGKHRRTIYDAYQLESSNGVNTDAFLLDEKQSRNLLKHSYSLMFPESKQASYPAPFKLLRYEQL
uniref:LRRCT domain-containing protein n=1 Tax=Syphacia muris TaxID=451379 RepID=A0A158R5A8_9BILA